MRLTDATSARFVGVSLVAMSLLMLLGPTAVVEPVFQPIAASGDAARLDVSVQSTASIGDPVRVTVTAFRRDGTVAQDYRGRVFLTSTDPGADLPAPYTFGSDDDGQHTFPALTFATSGSQRVSATDMTMTLSAQSESVDVVEVGARFLVAVAGSPSVGAPATVTVTALKGDGVTDTDYTGTVQLSSTTNPAATFSPAQIPFTAEARGVRTATVTFTAAGSQTVTATDLARPNRSGTLQGASVTAEPSTTTSSSSSTSSTSSSTTTSSTLVPTLAQASTTTSSTLAESSTTTLSTLVPSSTTTSSTLAESSTTTSSTLVPSSTTTSSTLAPTSTTSTVPSSTTTSSTSTTSTTVVPIARFSVTVPGTPTVGVPAPLTVTALNADGTTDTTYTGTVALSVTAAAATFTPEEITFVAADNGVVGTATVTFTAAGDQTITATDTVNPERTGTVTVTVQAQGGPGGPGTPPGPTPCVLAPGQPATSTALISPSSAAPGASVTVSNQGSCFQPVQSLNISLERVPKDPATSVPLGTTQSDEFGRFNTIVTIPATTALGSYQIEVTGPGQAAGTHTSSGPFTVTAVTAPVGAPPANVPTGTLPRTGAPTGKLAMAGALALAGGLILTREAKGSSRRRMAFPSA